MKNRHDLVKGAFFLLLIIILSGCSGHVPEELPAAQIVQEEEAALKQIQDEALKMILSENWGELEQFLAEPAEYPMALKWVEVSEFDFTGDGQPEIMISQRYASYSTAVFSYHYLYDADGNKLLTFAGGALEEIWKCQEIETGRQVFLIQDSAAFGSHNDLRLYSEVFMEEDKLEEKLAFVEWDMRKEESTEWEWAEEYYVFSDFSKKEEELIFKGYEGIQSLKQDRENEDFSLLEDYLKGWKWEEKEKIHYLGNFYMGDDEIIWEESKGSSEGKEQEKSYWTITVDEYEVSLKDLVPGTSLKLVLSKDESEVIAHIFQKNKEYKGPEEIMADSFEGLLGHNGFWVHISCYAYMDWTYFNAIEDGRMVCLAYSWGTEYRPGENYMVDIDKDGDLELICNVTFGGDGAERTYIYHYADGQIWEGSGSILLDEDYDDWGTNSTETEYLPDEEVIRIWFQEKEKGGYVSKDYKIDLGQLEMWPYEIGQMF